MKPNEFREKVYQALLKSNPAAPLPSEAEYLAALQKAKQSGAGVYLKWLDESAQRNPGKRLLWLHDECMDALNGRASVDPQPNRKQPRARCPHGRASREICMDCFNAEYPNRAEKPFEEFKRKIKSNLQKTPGAVS